MSSINPKLTFDNRLFLAPNIPNKNLLHILGSSGDTHLDEQLLELCNDTPGIDYPNLLASHLMTAARAALQGIDPHDLEMMQRTTEEILTSELLFNKYKNFRKVSIFGSARIAPGEPSYEVCKQFAEGLAKNGFMIITGAGPGIMQAGNEGAGSHRSFGLNISLPFESSANKFVKKSGDRLINYHYFFTRKLYFLKKADAFAAFPGGYGTMDEVFESLTLIQTGKAIIYPMVLIDAPGTTFWKNWQEFVIQELFTRGLISESDLSLIHITQDPIDAVNHIKQFYKIFHSYRFLDDEISLRLLQPIPESYIQELNIEFSDIIKGKIKQGHAEGAELAIPFLRALPRLTFTHKIKEYGRLRQLIDKINLAPECNGL